MLMAISFPSLSVRQVREVFDNADHRCPGKESAWSGWRSVSHSHNAQPGEATTTAAWHQSRLLTGDPVRPHHAQVLAPQLSRGVISTSLQLFRTAQGPAPAGVWSLQHPVVTTLAMIAVLLAVVVPLSVRHYARTGR
jgi:hypothetical protein